ncbi:Glutaredoxin, GrxC [mine drainage metagenome]|uniref:Glutaredoxin, GrxC n=1 Tax=mine drainage metagenome TaxID=410659 RepID=T1BNP8_9ZZZZ
MFIKQELAVSQPPILIYTTAVCPYCVAAKNLLKARGLGYNEMRVDSDPAARETMLARSAGRRTVPQIFIGARHVGGFDDLAAADRDGRLAAWLTEQGT